MPSTVTTTADDSTPITFTLTIDDSGNVLQVRPGDEVMPRLPLTGHQDNGWVMTVSPNPAVLGGGDDLRFFPSEVDQGGVAYHEFSFIAVGPGRTTCDPHPRLPAVHLHRAGDRSRLARPPFPVAAVPWPG